MRVLIMRTDGGVSIMNLVEDFGPWTDKKIEAEIIKWRSDRNVLLEPMDLSWRRETAKDISTDTSRRGWLVHDDGKLLFDAPRGERVYAGRKV